MFHPSFRWEINPARMRSVDAATGVVSVRKKDAAPAALFA